ncbi:hypothetical protein GcM3_064036 [Golovinomyces cichoracearum]|uniref:Uncharacterized protein n=1 Tax=Golovinomyces cichoracearum TaxID=62708 RepID=A0A420IV85_9PEZI|nr:hypothetical protein GcM3_064036 [Golovinomyces cichoracearum]
MQKQINLQAQNKLHPIQTPELFSRWVVEHTVPVFFAMEYATKKWNGSTYKNTSWDFGLLIRKKNIFNAYDKMEEFVVDNGKLFMGY